MMDHKNSNLLLSNASCISFIYFNLRNSTVYRSKLKKPSLYEATALNILSVRLLTDLFFCRGNYASEITD